MKSKEEVLKGEDPTVFLTKCAINFKFFCEKVMGFNIEPFHMEWFSALRKNKRIAIQAPTGFGKTQILAICYPIWLMMFNRDFKILVVSSTLPQSRKIIEEVKHSIEQNELLADLIPAKDIWTKEEINTNTNCKMICKPYNINIKGYHVDFLLCDEAASFTDTRIYYDYVVTRATSRNGTICCISTPESINDLMNQLYKSEEYWSKIYPGEKEKVALWPKRFPYEWLMKRKKEMAGEPGAYEREYLCDPTVSAGNNLYPPHILENTFDYNLKFTKNLEEGTVIGAFDFAIATGPSADFDAYIILERTGSGIFLRYGEFHKGLTIEAKARRIKALKEDYKIDKLIIDPNNVGQGVKSDLMKMGITVYEASFQSMARSKMLVNLRRLMGDPKDGIPTQLIIPRNKDDPQTMTFTNRLIDELLGFQAVKTLAGTDTYQSKARHDDTVMALAMGCSLISEQRGCLDFVAVG